MRKNYSISLLQDFHSLNIPLQPNFRNKVKSSNRKAYILTKLNTHIPMQKFSYSLQQATFKIALNYIV